MYSTPTVVDRLVRLPAQAQALARLCWRDATSRLDGVAGDGELDEAAARAVDRILLARSCSHCGGLCGSLAPITDGSSRSRCGS